MAHWRKAQIIVIIHDLMSLHRKRVTLETELSRLSKGDVIIASNEKMQQWLAQQGLQRPMTALGLFDYRSEAVPNSRQTSRLSLVYAGALVMRKNSYLLELAHKAEPGQKVKDLFGI